MSHSATTITTHRLHPTKEIAPRVTEWEIHLGMTGFLYIVGPGPSAMLRAYRDQTPARLAVMRRAVTILNRTKREDSNAGVDEIRAALVAVGWLDED